MAIQNPNDTSSNLLRMDPEFLKKNISRNIYKEGNPYNIGNKNALSDGDEKGKGEYNGSVGSKTDIATRKKLEAKNKYSETNPYNISNA